MTMFPSNGASSSHAGVGRRASSLRGFLAAGTLLVTLMALPAYAGFATQRLLVEVFTVFAIATAWNLLAGFGGLVAVGQHVFVGVGAYALFVISNGSGLNPWWTLPMAAAVSALFALLTAWPMSPPFSPENNRRTLMR